MSRATHIDTGLCRIDNVRAQPAGRRERRRGRERERERGWGERRERNISCMLRHGRERASTLPQTTYTTDSVTASRVIDLAGQNLWQHYCITSISHHKFRWLHGIVISFLSFFFFIFYLSIFVSRSVSERSTIVAVGAATATTLRRSYFIIVFLKDSKAPLVLSGPTLPPK